MRTDTMLDPGTASAKRCNRCFMPASAARTARLLLVLGAIAAFVSPALAVDGCLVLLCLAAPSWRAIPQCVPPVKQVFRDLARGRPFPSCSMAGGGNGANHQWASAPAYCPEQYQLRFGGESGPVYGCAYSGAVSVTIDGALWARTWWQPGGDNGSPSSRRSRRPSSARTTPGSTTTMPRGLRRDHPNCPFDGSTGRSWTPPR